MSSGLGPINAPPSARPPASPATACEVESGDGSFAAALEGAQAPAGAPRAASGATKARAAGPAKGAVPTPPPPAEPAAVDASAGDNRADPAKPAGADANSDAPKNQKAASEGPAGPDLSALLPGWPASPPARACETPALANTAGHDSAARSGAAVDLVQGDRGDRQVRRERTELASSGADLRATAAAQGAGTRPAPPLPSAAAMAAEAAPASTPRAGGDAPAALPLPALHASFMPATAASVASAATAAAAAAPTFEAHLAAALDSPVFAPALATQVSWLVREGVQHARLSLNPAEMGPVTVQIALDGTQARVDFSADIAATRAAIESSLPTLAAALHDRGLTLAGGGVFDGQPRPGTPGDRGQAAPNTRRADGPADASAEASRGSRASGPAQRGLVDLVA